MPKTIRYESSYDVLDICISENYVTSEAQSRILPLMNRGRRLLPKYVFYRGTLGHKMAFVEFRALTAYCSFLEESNVSSEIPEDASMRAELHVACAAHYLRLQESRYSDTHCHAYSDVRYSVSFFRNR